MTTCSASTVYLRKILLSALVAFSASAAFCAPADAPSAIEGQAGSVERQRPDGWITTKVKAGILAYSVNKGVHIHVSTVNGRVTLKGRLTRPDSVERFRSIAARVQGVKSVDASGIVIDVPKKKEPT